MKPPHWLCTNCGFIITGSGSEPDKCVQCNGDSWQYLGYDGEYDPDEARQQYINIDTKLKNLK